MSKMNVAIPLAVAAVTTLGIASCGGTSHNASTATVCQRLKTDLSSQQGSQPQNLDQAKSKLQTLSQKLKHDTSDAKDTQLRQAGQTAANDLDQALKQATSGSVTNAMTALRQAASAAQQVTTRCPGT